MRGRACEQSIQLDYLKNLNERYDDFIFNKYPGRVIVVDTEGLDFEHRPEDFASITDRIDAALYGLFPITPSPPTTNYKSSSYMHIAIAGNIGCGKTPPHMLARRYGWTPRFESVDNNPYRDYYEDMARWSFNLQIYQQTFSGCGGNLQSKETIVQDRTILGMPTSSLPTSTTWVQATATSTYTELFDLMMTLVGNPDSSLHRASIPNLIDGFRSADVTMSRASASTIRRTEPAIRRGIASTKGRTSSTATTSTSKTTPTTSDNHRPSTHGCSDSSRANKLPRTPGGRACIALVGHVQKVGL